MSVAIQRAENFCARFGFRVPILLAPMAGVHSPALSVAIANAGGLGACGALTLSPDGIRDWSKQVKSQTSGPFQINNWIPEPAPLRDFDHEARLKAFLSSWGPVPAGKYVLPNFEEQCEAMLHSGAPILSSVMGMFPPEFVAKMKKRGVIWFANISTVAEAKLAEAAGADVLVAQGCEAGGHRGCFNARTAEAELIGLMSLIPAVVDAVKLPVVATGGIADGRSAAGVVLTFSIYREKARNTTRTFSCLDTWCKRGSGRHRFFTLPRSQHRRSLGRRSGQNHARRHRGHTCVQRSGRPRHCDQFRARCNGERCPCLRAVPCAEGPHCGHQSQGQ